MANYSIKDLERLSGVKAHTIRIWEQRYNIVSPQRTNTNIRYYSDDDLRKLLSISLLNQYGYKISRIASFTDVDITREVKKVTEDGQDTDSQLAALTLCMIELDEDRFERLLASYILRQGFEATMSNIIFPFLERVGIMWMTGAIKPAQEHFVSNIIRQKLIVAIDGQASSAGDKGDLFMLFCPEGEFHEIGLLFANYLLRARRKRSIYLGASVPLQDVIDIFNVHNPNYLVCFVTSALSGEELQQYIYDLSNSFPNVEIWLAGNPLKMEEFDLPKKICVLQDLGQTINRIEVLNTATTSRN